MSDRAGKGSSGGEIASYRLDSAAYEPTAKRRLLRRLAWVVPLLGVFLAVQFHLMSRAQPDSSDTLLYVTPLCVGLVLFGMFRGFRSQLKNGRAGWESYQLTVGPNVLRRFIVNLPAVEIVRTEVTRIVESEVEGITVGTADRHRFIFIPRQLVGFGEVRERLSRWRAFESPRPVRQGALGAGWSALLIGAWIGTGVIPDIRLAMVSGVVLVVVAAILIRETLKLQVVENRQKAAFVSGYGFLLLAPLARLMLHFVYHADPVWPR